MVNEEIFASGSSYSPPPPEHDVASVKLAKQGVDEDSHQTVSELKQEIMLLKQESIEKDFLIGSLDQRLHQKFGDDFQPLSVEGEKIFVSSFDPVNPPSQHVNERVVRAAPDANIDTFFYPLVLLFLKKEERNMIELSN
uniref:Uncharacterized protein n=1 Tax=Lactuca sativa TaxID=4236 RepID=A0A9R1UK49_LACSA|nr:hypothetical protein LSAT_V11C900494070 [Lactuca sativa]